MKYKVDKKGITYNKCLTEYALWHSYKNKILKLNVIWRIIIKLEKPSHPEGIRNSEVTTSVK